MTTAVVVSHLKKEYLRGGVVALDGVDVEAASGQILVLLGSSGCGKTTLLRSIAGLETPTSGRITLGEQVVYDSVARIERRPSARNIGLVFQNFALWPHMTVAKNVAFPLKARHVRDRAGRVNAMLERVRCSELAGRLPSELSGGQQQRVALARALVAEPAVMLFDEPLSSLDAQLRGELRRELRSVHQDIGFTGIYVTHDLSEAMELGHLVAVMRKGQIVQIAAPEDLYSQPATAYVAEFLGIRNRFILRRTRGGLEADGMALSGQLDDTASAVPESGGMLFVRPTDVDVRSDGRQQVGAGVARFPTCTVTDRLFRGDAIEYVLECGDVTLLAETHPSACVPLKVGDSVTPEVRTDRMLVFPPRSSDRRLLMAGLSRPDVLGSLGLAWIRDCPDLPLVPIRVNGRTGRSTPTDLLRW